VDKKRSLSPINREAVATSSPLSYRSSRNAVVTASPTLPLRLRWVTHRVTDPTAKRL
jgi:hypothetical protein